MEGIITNQLICFHAPQESPFVLKYTVSGQIVKQIWPRKYPFCVVNPTISPFVFFIRIISRLRVYSIYSIIDIICIIRRCVLYREKSILR